MKYTLKAIETAEARCVNIIKVMICVGDDV